MSDIPLRKYLEDIDALIDRQQIDEAIAHCRHILSYYPKHVDTYRTLGKALLEKGRHGDAADIFQRVLSSVPDDFVSHVGMSIVREDEANLEAALWHMERAFEANPANGPIQDELRRLYGRRDGVVPPKARLTRGALARMYTKGELYPQAEAEIKAALSADAERVDLATVLATVYWNSDQRAEAAETCNDILQKLPYSQEANRIVAALLQVQGRANDAVQYRQRLEALDPYAAFVDPATDGHGAAHVNPDAVRIAPLNYIPGMAESPTGSPDWMASLGERFETPAALPSDSTPDWLRDSPMAEPTPVADIMPVSADMPDWMKDMQPTADAGAPPDLSFAPAEGSAPDWLADLSTTPAAPADEMPDWLKSATGPLTSSMMSRQSPAESALPAAPTPEAIPTAEGDIPDWMKPTTGPLAEADLPDWMKAGAPPVPTPAFAPPPAEGVPDWMKPAVGGLSSEDLPDWMKSGPAPATTPPAAEASDRMQSPAVEDARSEAMGMPAAQDEVPDWMKSALGESPAPAAFVETPEISETDLGAMSGDDALRWLEGLATQQGAKPEELVSQPPAAPAMPEPAAPAEALPPADELPAWMRPALSESEAAPLAIEGAESEAAPVGATAPLSMDALPEWMRGADALAGRRVETPPADDLGEAEVEEAIPTPLDQLPAWMRPAVSQGDASRTEVEQPAAPTPADDKPDWLKQMEAEADHYDALVTGQPAEAAEAEVVPVIDLPAWMKPAASHEEVQEPEAAAVPADDKPDWLKQMEAEADQYEDMVKDQPAEAPGAETKATARLPVELPDFLQIASPEAIARANEPTHLADETEGEKENWLAEVITGQTGEAEIAPVEAVEIPDWIKAMAPPAPAAPEPQLEQPEAAPPQDAAAPAFEEQPAAAPQPDLSTMEADEAMRWLEGLALQQGGKPEEMATPPEAEPAAAPEWLRAPTTETETPPADVPIWAKPREPGPSDSVANWLEGKKVPEWLRQPGEEAPMPPTEWLRAPIEEESASPAEEIPEWLKQPSAAAPTESTPPGAASAEPAAMSEADALRWLEGLASQQGAKPEELVSAPAADATPPHQTPAEPAPAQDMPEFLRKREAAPPAEAEDALRWMESLAAQQGARLEELVTRPEARAAQPPAWIAEQAAEMEAAAEAESAPAEEMPDWLKQMEPAFPAELTPAAAVETPAFEDLRGKETGTPPAADLASMSAEDALRWLEGLAAQQGARPEELVTPPEERTTQPPTWVAAQSAEPAPAAEAAPKPKIASGIELPPTLAAALKVEAPSEATPPQEPAEEGLSKLSRLAEKLAASKRVKESEIAARFEAQRAQQEAARLEVQRKMDEKRAPARASTGRLGTGPLETTTGTGSLDAKKGTGPLGPAPLEAKKGTGRLTPPAEAPAAGEPQAPAAEPAPRVERPATAARPRPKAPLRPVRARGRAAKSPYAVEPPDLVLAAARDHLAAENHAAAAEALGYLVATSQMVDDVIVELEEHAARRRASPPLLRVLGDAYMKNNRLQKALDTYRQALGQL